MESKNKLATILAMNPNNNDYQELLHSAQRFRANKLKIFHPGNHFPSISVTGKQCEMSCKYCDKQFLGHMRSATTPIQLQQLLEELVENNATGVLVSGGYTAEGYVPLSPFIPCLKKILDETTLILNLHVGLVNDEKISELLKLGIERVVISYDLIQDNRIIHEIIGLPPHVTSATYEQSYKKLVNAGFDVIPHIGVGMYWGQFSTEAIQRAITLSADSKARLIVFLGLLPKKKTPMEISSPPDPIIFQKILLSALLQLGENAEISFGCMRQKTTALDVAAIEAGIHRIEMPTKEAIARAVVQGLEIIRINSCCAI